MQLGRQLDARRPGADDRDVELLGPERRGLRVGADAGIDQPAVERLGLAQVYNVGKRSAGTARIKSVEGQGTRVELWLAAGRPERVLPAAPELIAAQTGRGERIVLVDDELDIRRTLARLLSESGYQVQTAANGADALALIDDRPPDLLVLDYAMPGLSGLDVAKAARANHPQLPILFMSGFADPKMLEEEMPAARLLRKPFGNNELFSAIRRSLLEGPA